jgi:hypothetical protein
MFWRSLLAVTRMSISGCARANLGSRGASHNESSGTDVLTKRVREPPVTRRVASSIIPKASSTARYNSNPAGVSVQRTIDAQEKPFPELLFELADLAAATA